MTNLKRMKYDCLTKQTENQKQFKLITFSDKFSNKGDFYLKFNQDVIFRDPKTGIQIDVTDFLNSTDILKIYVQPAEDRHLDPESGYKNGDLNLTWSIQDHNKTVIFIKVQFNNPLLISPLMIPDQLIIHFLLNASDYIFAPQSCQTLNKKSRTIIIPIRKQVEAGVLIDTLIASTTGMSYTGYIFIILGILLYIFVRGSRAQYLYSKMTRSFQQINAIPLFNVVIPANVMISNSMLQSALNFDVLALVKPWEFEFLNINYDEDGAQAAQLKFTQQINDYGYNQSNFLKNMSSFSVFLVYYNSKAVLLFIAYFIGFLFKFEWLLNKVKVYATLTFFGEIIAVTLESSLEILVSGYFSQMANLTKETGDITGSVLANVSLALVIIFMPILAGLVSFRNKEQLESPLFKQQFQQMYEGVKTYNSMSRAYNLIFLLKRILFVTIAFFLKDPILQIVFVDILNLASLNYFAFAEPAQDILTRRIELLNEITVVYANLHMFMYTDWIKDPIIQYKSGWSQLAFQIFVQAMNLGIVGYYAYKEIKAGCKAYLPLLRQKITYATKTIFFKYNELSKQVEVAIEYQQQDKKIFQILNESKLKNFSINKRFIKQNLDQNLPQLDIVEKNNQTFGQIENYEPFQPKLGSIVKGIRVTKGTIQWKDRNFKKPQIGSIVNGIRVRKQLNKTQKQPNDNLICLKNQLTYKIVNPLFQEKYSEIENTQLIDIDPPTKAKIYEEIENERLDLEQLQDLKNQCDQVLKELDSSEIQESNFRLEKLKEYNQAYINLKNFENKLRENRRQDYLSEQKPDHVRFQKEEYEKMIFQLKVTQEQNKVEIYKPVDRRGNILDIKPLQAILTSCVATHEILQELSEDEDSEIIQIALQRRNFILKDKAASTFNLTVQQQQTVFNQKMIFFKTKVFSEYQNSQYHYSNYHNNPKQNFPIQNINKVTQIDEEYLNLVVKAYKQCLFEYKLKKKIQEIEKTLLSGEKYISKAVYPITRKILIQRQEVNETMKQIVSDLQKDLGIKVIGIIEKLQDVQPPEKTSHTYIKLSEKYENNLNQSQEFTFRGMEQE